MSIGFRLVGCLKCLRQLGFGPGVESTALYSVSALYGVGSGYLPNGYSRNFGFLGRQESLLSCA